MSLGSDYDWGCRVTFDGRYRCHDRTKRSGCRSSRADQVVALPLNVLRDWALTPMPTSAQSVIQQGHAGRCKGWATAQMSSHVTSTGWPDAVGGVQSVWSTKRDLYLAVASPSHDKRSTKLAGRADRHQGRLQGITGAMIGLGSLCTVRLSCARDRGGLHALADATDCIRWW